MISPYFNTLQHRYRRTSSPAQQQFTPRSPPQYAIPARPPVTRDTNYGIMHHSLYVGGGMANNQSNNQTQPQANSSMFQSAQYYTHTSDSTRGNTYLFYISKYYFMINFNSILFDVFRFISRGNHSPTHFAWLRGVLIFLQDAVRMCVTALYLLYHKHLFPPIINIPTVNTTYLTSDYL